MTAELEDPHAGFIRQGIVIQAELNTSKQYYPRQRQKSNPQTGNGQGRQQTISKNKVTVQGQNARLGNRGTRNTQKLRWLGINNTQQCV